MIHDCRNLPLHLEASTGAPLRYALALLAYIALGGKVFIGSKHSSVFVHRVGDKEKCFVTLSFAQIAGLSVIKLFTAIIYECLL